MALGETKHPLYLWLLSFRFLSSAEHTVGNLLPLARQGSKMSQRSRQEKTRQLYHFFMDLALVAERGVCRPLLWLPCFYYHLFV